MRPVHVDVGVPMQYFTVLYKFDATEPTELGVIKGDVVRTDSFVDKDGWVFVELASNPRRRGFVPVGYVREIRGPLNDGSTDASSRSVSPNTPSYTNAALSLGTHVKDTAAAPDDNHHGVMVSSALPNPAAVVEGFMKNEVFYKQLMKQRQEAMQKIDVAIGDAATELAVCKDKNVHLTRRLRELDEALQKERSKWKQRVEEERVLLAQRSTTPLVAATVSTTTTSYARTAAR